MFSRDWSSDVCSSDLRGSTPGGDLVRPSPCSPLYSTLRPPFEGCRRYPPGLRGCLSSHPIGARTPTPWLVLGVGGSIQFGRPERLQGDHRSRGGGLGSSGAMASRVHSIQ